MSETKIEQFENFSVNGYVTTSICGMEYQDPRIVFSRMQHEDLCDDLESITNNETFFAQTSTHLGSSLFEHLCKINEKISLGNYALSPLSIYLENIFGSYSKMCENMISREKITFDAIPQLFVTGTKFVTTYFGKLIGGIIDKVVLVEDYNRPYYQIKGKMIFNTGKKFTQSSKNFTVKKFDGTQNISELHIRPIVEKEKIYLTNRGLQFVKYCDTPYNVQYTGLMSYFSNGNIVTIEATGRCMIDPISYHYKGYHSECNDSDSWSGENKWRNKTELSREYLESELLFTTWPFIDGYSFSSKKWGQFDVMNISNIVYADNAFDLLVLDQTRKDVIKSLVTNYSHGLTDIIQGKSGGCIFLLAGAPGTGKTLTAESIAELLHKPLYSVNVGELGTNASTVNERLQNVLSQATFWNAVLLIDEADIFIEKRSLCDIERNAIVGTFLRLLETYHGILFMTTNRADSMDEAFESRISLTFEYENLYPQTRRKIWTNLLTFAKVTMTEHDIDILNENDLNGREIKNWIRLSQCLAYGKSEVLNISHFETVKSVSNKKKFKQ
jgi:hypothetical protein